MYYKAIKDKYDKIILIDLKKAFDMVDRKILKNIIENKIENQIIKKITLNIIELYDTININIEGNDIYSTRGIPQGSAHGPLFFCMYIDEILDNINKIDNIHCQAFIDDIVLLSNDKQLLKDSFENIIQDLTKLKMELNMQKCEYISSEENDELIINDHKYTSLNKTK